MTRRFASPEFADYPEVWHFSPVVESNGFLFLSGQTGCRPDGSISNDPETQFRDAFGYVAGNLSTAGLGFRDVVEMTTYHVGLRAHLDAFTRVKDEFVPPPYPAWTAIGVSELISEDSLVEIKVIARRPEPSIGN